MNTPAPERIHALDMVRGVALLLGIVLHATMSFFLPLPVRDSSQSAALGVVFFVIHTFRMSLFFMLAGYFARMAMQRRGARAFAKDRALRIVVPMLVGWVVLAPLTVGILIVGLAKTTPNGGSNGSLTGGFPLTHLWFLYYLCIFYALALGAASMTRIGARVDVLVSFTMKHHLAPLVLAAPLFIVLYLDPAWSMWFGIPTPDQSLVPQLSALLGFGTAFGFGWLSQRQTHVLEVWRSRWAPNLAIAVSLSVTSLVLVETPDARLAYAASYTVSSWFWVFGLLGLGLRFFSAPTRVGRALAEASYWSYLVHVPIVFGLQVLAREWPLHWLIKFSLILAATMAVLGASWRLVRDTFVGQLLSGRTSAHSPRAAGPAAELLEVSKRYAATVALDGISFSVQPGELVALLGSNGAGKSTAIGLWLGTLIADEGTVRLMGGAPHEVQSRLGMGVMMQDVSLAPMLNAREHLELAASAYADPMSVHEVIAMTGLAGICDKRYGTLSGGQKRQVQFALAICGRPRILFLDEPTVGLDVTAREQMWRTIRSLLGGGCSVVLTTHYLEEAEALADRVAVLVKGTLVAEGSLEAMRALVTRKRISCTSTLTLEQIKAWPGVVDVVRDARHFHVTAANAEDVVRRLFEADPHLSELEVSKANLADALAELTKEAA